MYGAVQCSVVWIKIMIHFDEFFFLRLLGENIKITALMI